MPLPVVSGVTDALDKYNETIGGERITGAAIRNPLLRRLLFSPINIARPDEHALDLAAQAPTDADALKIAFKDKPLQRFVTTSLLDPLTYVGWGVPGALSKVPQLSKAAPALRALDRAEKVPGNLLDRGMTKASPLVDKAAEGLVRKTNPHYQRMLHDHPGFVKGLGTATKAWRDQALFSPAYSMLSATDNIARTIASGDLAVAREGTRGMLTGKSAAVDPTIERLTKTHAPGLPEELGQSLTSQRHSAWRDIRTGNPTVDRGLDKLAGGMEANARFVANRIDSPFRRAAFVKGYQAARNAGETELNAIQHGIDYQNHLYFNYRSERPIDKLGHSLFAFHRFSLNNLPFTAQMAVERPGVLNVPNEYFRSTDQYDREHGLTNRFHGEMPIGHLGNQDLFVNPLNLTSFGQLVRMATQKRDDPEGEGDLGSALSDLKDFGLGLNPLVDLPIRISGQYGRDMPQGLLRQGTLLSGVTGKLMQSPFDVEEPLKDTEAAAQQLVAGSRPFPYADWLLRKRLEEKSIADTGRPNDPRYVRAMGDRFSPLYRDAARDVADANFTQGLASLLGIPGFKTLGPEEKFIRDNRIPGAYSLADPMAEQIRNFENLDTTTQQGLLRDPIARDALMEHYSRRLHGR